MESTGLSHHVTSDALLLGIAPSIAAASRMTAAQLNAAVGNNVGNLAFVHAIDQQLGGGLRRFRRLEPAAIVNAAPERIAVVPCANHLGAHHDMAGEAKHFAAIDKPMVAIGLGAQASPNMQDLPDLPEGSQRWLRDLAERAPTSAPNISVRGEFTLRVLEKYGVADKAVALGCPTLFLNPEPGLGQKIAQAMERPIKRVAVAAGHFQWKHLWRIERSLARIVEEKNGAYILQSPLEMLKGYRGEWGELDDAKKEMMRDSIMPGASIEQLEHWYRQYSIAIFDIPAWMNYLRSFDLVIGPRIHGVMLGLQAGVPGLCIAHDSRTVELCRTMRVPYVTHSEVRDGFDLAKAITLVKFDPDAFDGVRKDLSSRYREFLNGNSLSYCKQVFGVDNAD
jgi:hypothetical protein